MTSKNLIGTNLELFGSDIEKKIKEASANSEPAWHNIDLNKIGLYVWRIEKFKLVVADTNGSFHEGDSYVILNIHKDNSDNFKYDIHFWLGNKTTQDEMGTAAYKTVELDTFLHGKATQYREIQQNESDLFISYFPKGIEYKLGGIESGFRKVQKNDYSNYQNILMKIHNNGYYQMPLAVQSLTDDDVYLLDSGLIIYVYEGIKSTNKEKFNAHYMSQNIKNNRKDCKVKYVSDSFMTEFLNMIYNPFLLAYPGNNDLHRITEIDNHVTVEKMESPSYSLLSSDDSYVFNASLMTFIWIGKQSSYNETLNAWKVAFELTDTSHPIVLVREGNETESFRMFIK